MTAKSTEKMTAGDNAEGKWREKNMEGEDTVKTLESLRGRLLAERVASRNAKEEAEQLGNKLIELEKLLQVETKSRNKAEKKLKSLMKKLESMNILYVSDESEHSSLLDISEISSVSSTTSSSAKELEDKRANAQIKNTTTMRDIQDSIEPVMSEIVSEHLKQSCKSSQNNGSNPQTEESLNSETEANSVDITSRGSEMEQFGNTHCVEVPENFEHNVAGNAAFYHDDHNSAAKERFNLANEAHSEFGSTQIHENQRIDEHSLKSSTREDAGQEDDLIDNSMALVLVDEAKTTQRIDPEVLDATVKEVLDALKHAKERLLSSMERRRANFIRVS